MVVTRQDSISLYQTSQMNFLKSVFFPTFFGVRRVAKTNQVQIGNLRVREKERQSGVMNREASKSKMVSTSGF